MQLSAARGCTVRRDPQRRWRVTSCVWENNDDDRDAARKIRLVQLATV